MSLKVNKKSIRGFFIVYKKVNFPFALMNIQENFTQRFRKKIKILKIYIGTLTGEFGDGIQELKKIYIYLYKKKGWRKNSLL